MERKITSEYGKKYMELIVEIGRFIKCKDKNMSDYIALLKIITFLGDIYYRFEEVIKNRYLIQEKEYETLYAINKTTIIKIEKYISKLNIPNESKNNLIWSPYISRYENELSTIKLIFKNVNLSFKKYRKKLIDKQHNNDKYKKESKLLSKDIILYEKISIAISLRYCIEMFIYQLKNNNFKEIKKNIKIDVNNKTKFIDLLDFYENSGINFKLRTFEKNKSKLIIKNFWDKDVLNSEFNYLSGLIHFHSSTHPNWYFISMNEAIKDNDPLYDYVELRKIYKTLYLSIKNHTTYFEKGKCILKIKNFKVYKTIYK